MAQANALIDEISAACVALAGLSAEVEAQATTLEHNRPDRNLIDIATALPEIEKGLFRNERYRQARDGMCILLPRLADEYQAGDHAARLVIIGAAVGNETLIDYLNRVFYHCTDMYERTKDDAWIVRALTLACIADMQPDYRDWFSSLYGFYVSIRDKGVDPMTYFARVGATAVGEGHRWLLRFNQTSAFRDIESRTTR